MATGGPELVTSGLAVAMGGAGLATGLGGDVTVPELTCLPTRVARGSCWGFSDGPGVVSCGLSERGAAVANADGLGCPCDPVSAHWPSESSLSPPLESASLSVSGGGGGGGGGCALPGIGGGGGGGGGGTPSLPSFAPCALGGGGTLVSSNGIAGGRARLAAAAWTASSIGTAAANAMDSPSMDPLRLVDPRRFEGLLAVELLLLPPPPPPPPPTAEKSILEDARRTLPARPRLAMPPGAVAVGVPGWVASVLALLIASITESADTGIAGNAAAGAFRVGGCVAASTRRGGVVGVDATLVIGATWSTESAPLTVAISSSDARLLRLDFGRRKVLARRATPAPGDDLAAPAVAVAELAATSVTSATLVRAAIGVPSAPFAVGALSSSAGGRDSLFSTASSAATSTLAAATAAGGIDIARPPRRSSVCDCSDRGESAPRPFVGMDDAISDDLRPRRRDMPVAAGRPPTPTAAGDRTLAAPEGDGDDETAATTEPPREWKSILLARRLFLPPLTATATGLPGFGLVVAWVATTPACGADGATVRADSGDGGAARDGSCLAPAVLRAGNCAGAAAGVADAVGDGTCPLPWHSCGVSEAEGGTSAVGTSTAAARTTSARLT